MDEINSFERLSPHVKYAIAKNAVLRKGEHQHKLKAIYTDHQMKANEIWHNRTQAARDYIIVVMNSAPGSQSSNLRCNSRLSAAKDRGAMARIQELSDLYLSRTMLQKFDTKKIHQSLLSSTSGNKAPIFITQETPETPTDNTLPTINQRTLSSSESRFNREGKTNRKLASIFSDPDYLSHVRKREVHSQSCRDRPNIFEEGPSSPLPPSLQIRQRPSTCSVTLPIRRRSCRLSVTAKALLQLQQMQQRARMTILTRESLSHPCETHTKFVQEIKKTSQTLPKTPLSTVQTLRQEDRSISAEDPQNSQEVDQKIKGFCDQLESESGSDKWKKYNTKWSILKNYVRSGSARLTPASDNTDAYNNLGKPNTTQARKLSVRFAESVSFD